MENIYYVMSAHYVINIRVGFNTFKGKGIMVISHKRIFILKCGQNISFFPFLSLSRVEVRELLSLLSSPSRPPSLFLFLNLSQNFSQIKICVMQASFKVLRWLETCHGLWLLLFLFTKRFSRKDLRTKVWFWSRSFMMSLLLGIEK